MALIGIITILLGATLALAQKDIKKSLAYSTMSQLGYTMLALGTGSYRAALFHLITHAYSKALLFLGSGSIIHSMKAQLLVRVLLSDPAVTRNLKVSTARPSVAVEPPTMVGLVEKIREN